VSLVLKTLEAFPRGRTTQELFALLDVDFDHASRRRIQEELNNFQRDGVISLGRDRKWRASTRSVIAVKPTDTAPTTRMDPANTEAMIACTAEYQVELVPDTAEPDVETAELPDPSRLLRYYRAALQSDPRGALTQSDDRHGTSFQLLSGQGSFFPQDKEQGLIRIKLDVLPDSFREAVFRREANENALAVGWPIAIGRQNGVPAIRPVGLMAATWERNEQQLLIRIPSNDILINPDWLKAAARGSAWSEGALRDVFKGQGSAGLQSEELLSRLKEAAAKSIRGQLTGRNFVSSLEPTDEGIFNSLGLFLPTASSFTAGAVRDLDTIAAWGSNKLARTALAPFLGLASEVVIEAANPINIGPLNHEQIQSVANAMSQPLSVVTGPPGTGKSQAIVAMAATALLQNKNVIVASKNHQALDAVQERIRGIAPEVSFSVRTLDPENDVNESIASVLQDIVRNPSDRAASVDPETLRKLWELAGDRSHALAQIERRRALNLRLAECIERVELREKSGATGGVSEPAAVKIGLLRRIWQWLRGRQALAVDLDAPQSMTLKELCSQIDRDRAELRALEAPGDPVAMTGKIQEIAKGVLKKHLGSRASPGTDLRATLGNAHDDLALSGIEELSRDITQMVLELRPLWLASVLGTPKRVPLFDGLFDLVIFDEASQCDIASALPLLARAKRAVVVGDDRQLAFISQIGAAQDRNLMAAQGLPSKGMGRYAQGRKSLFDFANSTPGVAAVMLRDQYRSAEGIVDYINGNFYQGRLRVSADPNGFRVPRGTLEGLAWKDVPGQVSPHADRQNVNPAEVKAITAHLKELLQVQAYNGSVGVISPFRPQVAALQQALQEQLPEELWERASMRVATVDGFQGQERDLILFSPTVHARSATTAITFLQRDWRRLNVAISRARAVAHVFGDLAFARSGKIKSLARLAARATEPRLKGGEAMFDSEWERITYHALRGRGLDPIPQYDIAGRRLDFALFGANGVKLDLEVDGRRWHQDIDGNRKIDDHWRDHQMKSLGWKVRRFWVDEIKKDMEGCIDLIERDLG
jgi:very-short-patch-repair endonuclease